MSTKKEIEKSKNNDGNNDFFVRTHLITHLIIQQHQYDYSNICKWCHNKSFSLQFEEIFKMASNVLQGTYHWVDNGANWKMKIELLSVNVNGSQLTELVLLENEKVTQVVFDTSNCFLHNRKNRLVSIVQMKKSRRWYWRSSIVTYWLLSDWAPDGTKWQ